MGAKAKPAGQRKAGRVGARLARICKRIAMIGAAVAMLAVTVAWFMMELTAAASAAEGPQLTVNSVSKPTNFAPGDSSGHDAYIVSVTNTGSVASTSGMPITVTAEPPLGLSLDPTGASGEDELLATEKASGAKLSCLFGSCVYTGVLVPDDTLIVRFPVDVAAEAPPTVTTAVRVSGGGATVASVETPTAISNTPAEFGISPGGASTALSTLQAGAHPDLTTAIAFNTVASGGLAGDPKDTTDDLPAGFAGDLVDTPTCSATQFLQSICPIGTQIGITTLTLTETGKDKGVQLEPVYNLTPAPGDVAKIGFTFGGVLFFEGDVTVRPNDYGIEATFHNASEGSVELEKVSLTVWGVPAAAIHDPLRWSPGKVAGEGALGTFGTSSDAPPAPYLSAPTGCATEALQARFSVNSWEHPEDFVSAPMPFGPPAGCDRLGMQPSVIAEATTDNAYSATGLNLVMTVPQTYGNANGLVTSTLKRAVVTLPEGMTVNPSAGAGLAACTEAEYAEEEAAEAPAAGGCPSASKLGTVKIRTPSLNEEATGTVFIAQPYANPFGSLLALYVVARIPDRGVVVRAAGHVVADETTGRLVTTFDDLPPLPFSSLAFRFNQGATSPLVTPPLCGEYTVQADLTPLSDPTEVLSPEVPAFPITHGFGGGACASGGLPPFNPQLTSGTTNNRAGSYSELDIRITREDGEQEISRFSSQLPPGLTANLTGVPFCSDAAIEVAKGKSGAEEEVEPSCPSASLIGHTLVGAGVGSVLAYTPGRLYMAGPYHGAPFSIVAITSAKVGPFDLGTVVVRVALRIDPNTAVVTADGAASDPIPHIIKGIVVHVRDIRVYVDRPKFTLNPTSCEKFTLRADIGGAGASFTSPLDDVTATVSNPFQAIDCQALAFKPTFRVTTSAKTSRLNGASLNVKLTFPSSGAEANVRSVKVDLPRSLPSRLTTLQKACRENVFAANPEDCPAASRVGQAKAVTPILPVPLTGPAYFVSHGGAKFPELIVVLKGYGVTVYLHGETFIRNGITSSTFRMVPDQPVTSFELSLPAGPNSALAAYGNLCSPKKTVTQRKVSFKIIAGKRHRVSKAVKRTAATTLAMPTAFTAQNGDEIHQPTVVEVAGCKTKLRGTKPR